MTGATAAAAADHHAAAPVAAVVEERAEEAVLMSTRTYLATTGTRRRRLGGMTDGVLLCRGTSGTICRHGGMTGIGIGIGDGRSSMMIGRGQAGRGVAVGRRFVIEIGRGIGKGIGSGTCIAGSDCDSFHGAWGACWTRLLGWVDEGTMKRSFFGLGRDDALGVSTPRELLCPRSLWLLCPSLDLEALASE